MTAADRIEQVNASIVAEQLKDPDFDLAASVAWCREEIERSQARLRALEKHLSHPVVMPVLHFHRYHSEVATPLRECLDAAFGPDLLREAYGTLTGMLENGLCSPDGVSVGGCMVTWDELGDEFGENETW